MWLFSSVLMEGRSDDSCVQLVAFRWLDPLPTRKGQLQTHLTNLQATFECDGTCRRVIGVVDRLNRATDRFCCIRVDSLCLCRLRRHEETSRSCPDLCPRTHLGGRRLHVKNLECPCTCDTLTTLRYSTTRNQSRKRNRGHPNILPLVSPSAGKLAMLGPGLRDLVSSVRKRCWETRDVLRIVHNKTLHSCVAHFVLLQTSLERLTLSSFTASRNDCSLCPLLSRGQSNPRGTGTRSSRDTPSTPASTVL